MDKDFQTRLTELNERARKVNEELNKKIEESCKCIAEFFVVFHSVVARWQDDNDLFSYETRYRHKPIDSSRLHKLDRLQPFYYETSKFFGLIKTKNKDFRVLPLLKIDTLDNKEGPVKYKVEFIDKENLPLIIQAVTLMQDALEEQLDKKERNIDELEANFNILKELKLIKE